VGSDRLLAPAVVEGDALPTIAEEDFARCIHDVFAKVTLPNGHDAVVDVPMMFSP
jgi:hypothetical protein